MREIWRGPLLILTATVLTLGLTPSWAASHATVYPDNTLTVLHTFEDTDGESPSGSLIQDSAGNFYGTTQYGGAWGFGSVFELSPDGQGGWTFSTLYSLTGDVDGAFPSGTLAMDAQGNLYGTDLLDDVYGNGAVYEISKASNGTWYLANSYNFDNSFGGKPNAGVTLAPDGIIYGTTHSNFWDQYGAIFELVPDGRSWTEHTLYLFPTDGSEGEYPDTGSLVLDRAGNLFGMTASGGPNNGGTVFRLRNTEGGWILNTLYSFSSATDYWECSGTLAMDQFGSLYGSCPANPIPITIGGAVFKLTPASTADQAGTANPQWQINWLYHFTGGADGGGPAMGVTFDSAGNLYGFTDTNLDPGVVYKLTHSGSTWTESVLYEFSGGADGNGPIGPPFLDSAGNVYGVAIYGGDRNCNPYFGCGTVWKLSQ